MNTFSFCYIDKKYIDYLRKFDSKVSLKNSRAFLAIVIKSSDFQYAIPFTSEMLRQNGKRRNQRTTTEIKDATNNYGALLHNNMIPVVNEVFNEIDFSTDIHKDLLEQEYIIVRKNFSNIEKKTQDVYNNRINNDDEFYIDFCCNFKLLEQKCIDYCKINSII